LSVTTSWNVTLPLVFGTVTATLDTGAVTVVDGFAGVSSTAALGVGVITGAFTGVMLGAAVVGLDIESLRAGIASQHHIKSGPG
jgi:hypothetical protein